MKIPLEAKVKEQINRQLEQSNVYDERIQVDSFLEVASALKQLAKPVCHNDDGGLNNIKNNMFEGLLHQK